MDTVGRTKEPRNDPLAAAVGFTPVAKEPVADVREYRRKLRADRLKPPPLGKPSDDRRYMLCTRHGGGVYAVAFADGWIPTHAVGPFGGDQLAIEPGQQDWSDPQDARLWNVAGMVALGDGARQRMIEGTSRVSVAATASRRLRMAGRKVTEKPVFEKVREEATAAISETLGDDQAPQGATSASGSQGSQRANGGDSVSL